ncbi:MAG TPA: hypothetical protein VH143_16980 [Kofleriaceae bacterium]|jgi:hypothetical protein|nr:hypothetical protein [Kofleriaceae bacterium]
MTSSFATDLAALADDARDRVPILAAVFANEREREDRVALLVLARTYADRVARAAFGAVLLALTAASLVSLAFAAARQGWVGVGQYVDGGAAVAWTSCFERVGYSLGALGIAAVVAGVARRRAMHYFARAVATPDPIATGRGLLARVEPWFAVAWTSGVVMFCAYVGFASALGISTIADEVFAYDSAATTACGYVRDLCIALPIVVAASVRVARQPPKWLATRYATQGSLIVALVALAVDYNMMVSDAARYYFDSQPLQSITTVVGTAALWVWVSALVQRRK